MFNLHSLGWHSFQQLCLSVTRESLGQTVEAFLDTNDGGRDGAFTGTWKLCGGETLTGKFVIQCKFTSRPGYSLQVSDLNQEMSKVQRLVEQGRCDVYVLMTNAGVSAETELKIKEKLEQAGVKSMLSLGRTWIEQQIRESKRLRMMVPRVYGLGDLSQILDERAYSQATAVLEAMREDLAKVVVTESYRKAARALDAHGFVLLIGEPAAGKTTIASMLAMASADQWGASVMKLDHPKSVVDHWNPHEKSQFFWIDDAFGVTQYESGLVMGWNHVLPQMKTLLRQGCRVVMTSRDYIYNRARQELKEGAFPLFHESQVFIDVHDLSADERRQILYNHLKLGAQPREFLAAVKPHLEAVADYRRFIPEIARRLADPFFTKDLHLSQWALERFVEQREQFLIDVCNGLDADSKAALALVYMRNGHLPSPIQLAAAEEDALARMSSSMGACSTALQALRGSLVSHTVVDGDSFWTYRHPTIGDAYASILRTNPELLGIYVRGSDIDKLMEQVTCGDMQIEGAVILPKSLYGLLIERLNAYKASSSYKTEWLSTWGAKRSLLRFLGKRCGREFLEMYLAQSPQVIESISKPSLYLDYSPEVDLVLRLFSLGLLTEDARSTFVQTVVQYALDGDDARVLSDANVRAMLTTEELDELKQGVLVELVPRLANVRRNVQSNHELEDDPEGHMRHFMEVLDSVEQEFPDEQTVKMAVEHERSRVKAWIDEQPSESREESPRRLTVSESDAVSSTSRSVFDDVEE
jgi:energy-coupling factor transporter ATP-binding protein EcfA2